MQLDYWCEKTFVSLVFSLIPKDTLRNREILKTGKYKNIEKYGQLAGNSGKCNHYVSLLICATNTNVAYICAPDAVPWNPFTQLYSSHTAVTSIYARCPPAIPSRFAAMFVRPVGGGARPAPPNVKQFRCDHCQTFFCAKTPAPIGHCPGLKWTPRGGAYVAAQMSGEY